MNFYIRHKKWKKVEFDFERFKDAAMKAFYEVKKMGGTDGVFPPMLLRLVESML